MQRNDPSATQSSDAGETSGGGATPSEPPPPARDAGAGGVDYVQFPAHMAQQLRAVGERTSQARRGTAQAMEGADAARLVALLRRVSQVDFADYREGTLQRRLQRRMNMLELSSIAAYVAHAEAHPQELQQLAKDVLIGVTRFFRDRPLFEHLRHHLFPQLLQRLNSEQPIRLWSVGCASGQEPYSLALTLAQAMADCGVHRRVQIFATDIDADALAMAREGRYPEASEAELGDDVVQRYFLRTGGHLVVQREIRDMVLFSRQDVLADPPFRGVHLASCRNLLIYFRPAGQRRALGALHHALCSEGLLVLGEADTDSEAPELFALQDRHNRIFVRRAQPLQFATLAHRTAAATALSVDEGRAGAPGAQRLGPTWLDERLLSQWCRPGVLTDENMRVLDVRGPLEKYFSFNIGLVDPDLFALLPATLHDALRQAVVNLPREGREVVVPVWSHDDLTDIVVNIMPVHHPDGSRQYYFKFAPAPPMATSRTEWALCAGRGGDVLAPAAHVQALQREIGALQGQLKRATAGKDVAVHALRSVEDASRGTHGALQRANQELHASREEIQSANEELIVVNEELKARMQELSVMQGELFCLLEQIRAPVLIVSADLRLRRYSKAAAQLFDLSMSDIGRPIDYVGRNFHALDLRHAVAQAVAARDSQSSVVQHVAGKHYTLTVSCFFGPQQIAGGSLLFFAPAAAAAGPSGAHAKVRRYAERHWGHWPQAVFVCSRGLEGVWANAAFYDRFSLVEHDFQGVKMADTALREALGPSLLAYVQKTVACLLKATSLQQHRTAEVACQPEGFRARTRALDGAKKFFRISLTGVGHAP